MAIAFQMIQRRGMKQGLIDELEKSLKNLGTEHVDILFAAHGATHVKHLECPNFWMRWIP